MRAGSELACVFEARTLTMITKSTLNVGNVHDFYMKNTILSKTLPTFRQIVKIVYLEEHNYFYSLKPFKSTIPYMEIY